MIKLKHFLIGLCAALIGALVMCHYRAHSQKEEIPVRWWEGKFPYCPEGFSLSKSFSSCLKDPQPTKTIYWTPSDGSVGVCSTDGGKGWYAVRDGVCYAPEGERR